MSDDDPQEAGTVDAVDSNQLDIRGRRTAGDPGRRASRILTQDINRLRNSRDDRGALQNHHMGVGNQGNRAAALIGFTVKNNRS